MALTRSQIKVGSGFCYFRRANPKVWGFEKLIRKVLARSLDSSRLNSRLIVGDDMLCLDSRNLTIYCLFRLDVNSLKLSFLFNIQLLFAGSPIEEVRWAQEFLTLHGSCFAIWDRG
jgi:hypothetical protein